MEPVGVGQIFFPNGPWFAADALDVAQLGLGEELRALALISLGIAELWSLRLHEAEGHLERGVALARRIGRPFLEISGLAHWGLLASFRSPALAVERGRQAGRPDHSRPYREAGAASLGHDHLRR